MKKFFLSVALLATAFSATAGGYLTNTNQSVAFLRNPAQDAAVNLNGVYSNPAGVSFLSNGIHLGVNWQAAFQTREITSTFGPFAYGQNNGGRTQKYFEGRAAAPVIPSLQAAWVKDRWTLQFNFALVGGGGKAEFENGLGSFESQVALLGMLGKNQNLGFDKYDVDAYMRGKQYYFGTTLGSSYKITNHLSAYLGLRGIYATANYYGYLKNIRINAGAGGAMVGASGYFNAASDKYKAIAAAAQAAGQHAAAAQAATAARTMGVLGVATQDVLLNTDQSAFGIAPIVGVHYHHDKFDVAAKYEFSTRLEFKNTSANSASADNLTALAAYKDGAKVRGDIPALLTLGVQYRPIERLRLNAGYHYYFDREAKSGSDVSGWKNQLLDHGTMEYNVGAEYDVNEKFELSAGMQRTIYPNTNAFVNDLSFNVNSYSVGLGLGYRLNDRVKFNVAYFQTFYGDYTKTADNYNNTANIIAKAQGEERAKALVASGALRGTDHFTRSNKVFGIGAEFKF